jgi:hypothetical protein
VAKADQSLLFTFGEEAAKATPSRPYLYLKVGTPPLRHIVELAPPHFRTSTCTCPLVGLALPEV